MKVLKKVLCVAIIAVLSLSVMGALAGCGSNKKLVVSTMFGAGDQHEATFLDINAKFLAANSGAKIENRSGAAESEDWKNGFAADMGSKKNVPDVMFYFSGTPMDEWRDKVVKVADIQKEFPDFAKNIVRNDNDPASIEMKLGVQGVMYNTDVYSKEELSTFDGMMTALKANKDDTNKKAAVSGDLPHYWYNHLMAYYLGAAEFKAMDGTKAYFTDAKKALWIEASVKAINDMREIGFVGRGPNNGTEATAFYAGTRGIAIDGQWVAGNIDKAQGIATTKDKIDLAVFPKNAAGDKIQIGGITNGWYISKNCWDNKAKRKLAVDYIMMNSTDEALNKYCVAGGGFPANGKEVTGAGYGSKKFAGLVTDSNILVAIDDRVPALAKTALYGDWTVNLAFPKLLEQPAAPTKAEITTVIEAFIKHLN